MNLKICSCCKEYTDNFYKELTICRTCKALKRREWREKNPGKDAASAKRYRENHPDKARKAVRTYAKNNPDIIKSLQKTRDKHKQKETKRAYRNRKLSAEGSFSQKDFIKLCESFNYTCLCCKNRFDIGGINGLTADHIIPLTKNGTDFITNIQCLCGKCNRIKSTKIIDYRSFIPKFIQEKLNEIIIS